MKYAVHVTWSRAVEPRLLSGALRFVPPFRASQITDGARQVTAFRTWALAKGGDLLSSYPRFGVRLPDDHRSPRERRCRCPLRKPRLGFVRDPLPLHYCHRLAGGHRRAVM